MVEQLCDIDSGLTPWEVEFVESISKQVEQGRALSEKQFDIGYKILERLR
jgi:hypothetical protein